MLKLLSKVVVVAAFQLNNIPFIFEFTFMFAFMFMFKFMFMFMFVFMFMFMLHLRLCLCNFDSLPSSLISLSA